MRNRRIIKIKIRERNSTIWINKKSRYTSKKFMDMIELHVRNLLIELGALDE